MGLNWTRINLEYDSKILYRSYFPSDKIDADIFWRIWNIYKLDLKKDGFSIRKRNNLWEIVWIKSSEDETTIDEKLKKWTDIFNKLYSELYL